jgi:DNA-binding NtrC family response regulator
LARHFVNHFCKQHAKPDVVLTADCLRVLKDHHWPGNVRELQNTVERAVILSEPGHALSPVVLGLGEGSGPSRAASSVRELTAGKSAGDESARVPLAEVEKNHILKVLDACSGNRTQAADVLEISIRTLRNKLNEYRGEEGGAETVPEAPRGTRKASQIEAVKPARAGRGGQLAKGKP